MENLPAELRGLILLADWPGHAQMCIWLSIQPLHQNQLAEKLAYLAVVQ